MITTAELKALQPGDRLEVHFKAKFPWPAISLRGAYVYQTRKRIAIEFDDRGLHLVYKEGNIRRLGTLDMLAEV